MTTRYRIMWPTGAAAEVTLVTKGHGFSVEITGARELLTTVFDYRTEDAIRTELKYIACRDGAELQIEEGAGRG